MLICRRQDVGHVVHKVGDLVIVRYSKAKHLKNILNKVLSTHTNGTYNTHVVNTKGQHSDHPYYRLRTLEEVEKSLQRDVEHAGLRLDRCKERLRNFQEQAKTAESYFPKV